MIKTKIVQGKKVEYMSSQNYIDDLDSYDNSIKGNKKAFILVIFILCVIVFIATKAISEHVPSVKTSISVETTIQDMDWKQAMKLVEDNPGIKQMIINRYVPINAYNVHVNIVGGMAKKLSDGSYLVKRSVMVSYYTKNDSGGFPNIIDVNPILSANVSPDGVVSNIDIK